MSEHRLPDSTCIGMVHLRVRDRARALSFYRDQLGLSVIEAPRPANGGALRLSADGAEPALVLLSAQPDAVPKPPRTTGLYHVAIRLPDRAALGRLLQRLLEARYPLQGAADHGVSEALYLADPDGNGLELYTDRPRDQWQWDGDSVQMVTDPLDAEALLAQATDAPWTGIDSGTDIGHIHLHVGDLRRAEAFWCDLLGFEVMQRSYPGALFVAAGGYHHHVGLNIWAGRDAPAPPPDAVGLVAASLRLPDEDARAQVCDRLADAGIALHDTPDGPLVRDTDGNAVVLSVGAPVTG